TPSSNPAFQSDGGSNVAIRGLEVHAVPGYSAMTCVASTGTSTLSLRDMTVDPTNSLAAVGGGNCHITLTRVVAGILSLADSSLIANQIKTIGLEVTTATNGSTSIQITNSVLGGVDYYNAHGGSIRVSYSTFTGGQFCDTPIGTRPTVTLDDDVFTCSSC